MGNECEVKVEDILELFNGSSGFVSEDFDKVGFGFVMGRFECVVVELFYGVFDFKINLGVGEGIVDVRGGFGGVIIEKVLFVEDVDVIIGEVDGVCCWKIC